MLAKNQSCDSAPDELVYERITLHQSNYCECLSGGLRGMFPGIHGCARSLYLIIEALINPKSVLLWFSSQPLSSLHSLNMPLYSSNEQLAIDEHLPQLSAAKTRCIDTVRSHGRQCAFWRFCNGSSWCNVASPAALFRSRCCSQHYGAWRAFTRLLCR